MQHAVSMQPFPRPALPKANEPVALEDCLRILLRGIQDHSVNADGADAQQFRTQLAVLESRFQGKESARQLVDSAVAILDKYGSQANKLIARQKSGLAEAASQLASANNVERWNRLEQQIKAISPGEDLDVAKARLCADLAAARAEILQERQEMGNVLSEILGSVNLSPKQGAGETPQSQGLTYLPDPLTGLPLRAHAEAELARAHAQSSDCHLALFVVRRLALINAKFGYARGDQVLLKVGTHLAQAMPEYKSLFRWTPCAFLTVTPPNTPYRDLRSKVRVIAITRMAPTLEWEGRSAMVPVTLNCRIISVKDFGTPYDLFLRLDTLAADV